jgi:hypothetical protein
MGSSRCRRCQTVNNKCRQCLPHRMVITTSRPRTKYRNSKRQDSSSRPFLSRCRPRPSITVPTLDRCTTQVAIRLHLAHSSGVGCSGADGRTILAIEVCPLVDNRFLLSSFITRMDLSHNLIRNLYIIVLALFSCAFFPTVHLITH